MSSFQELNDRIIFTHSSNPNTSVEVLKFGAHVLSWKVNGKEHMWMSPASPLDGSAAIRGGIPLVFPVFTTNPAEPVKELPMHGFARLSTWEFLGQSGDSIKFGLSAKNAHPELFATWPVKDFGLVYTVELGENTLKSTIEVSNPTDEAFEFHALFHTYLELDDVEKTQIKNISGGQVLNKLTGEVYTADSDLEFTCETARIYYDVDDSKAIDVSQDGKTIYVVEKENMPDIVCWNPAAKAAAGMADFGPADRFKTMVCVEPGQVREFYKLQPGQTWSGSQLLRV